MLYSKEIKRNKKIKMKKKLRKGIFLVIYFLEKEKPKYLILKRKLHWTGWEFTKGGIEKFETKKMAAKREGKEETGLKLFNIKRYSHSGRYVYPKSFKDRIGYSGQTFTLFSAEAKDMKSKIKIDPKEHSSFKWVNYSEAVKKLTHKNQKESLKIVNNFLKEKFK